MKPPIALMAPDPTDEEVARAHAVIAEHVEKNIQIILERNRLYALSSPGARRPIKGFRKSAGS